MKRISVLGAGSWGTAIAKLLCDKGHSVKLWSFDEAQAVEMNRVKENKEFLPDITLQDNLVITSNDEEAINNSEIVVIAVPSKFVRTTVERFKKYLNENHIIVNLSKGIEEKTLLRLSEVIEEIVPFCKIAVLSGPSHAEEVVRNIPTTVTVSSKDIEVAEIIQTVFMTEMFRIYTNPDLIGVELGGALKNIIALCAGISDGLGYGDNTKAALMTRGLAEISRLGIKMGGISTTFQGLAGVGDLIVTCTSMHSRNRRAGILIGEGMTLDETLKTVHMVVEGVECSKAAFNLSKKYNVEMPIVSEAYKVLFEDKNPREAVYDLMTRDKKSEINMLGNE